MRKVALFSALTLIAGVVSAQQETARVISVTPVMQQVSVPRQVCGQETVTTAPTKSGAGAAMGAIAGGAMGNAVGQGNGRAAATMIGILGGAILGDKIEGGDAAQTQTVQRCVTQHILENRIVNYNVVYEYGGKQYSVQMPHDPGPTLRLQITPVGAAATQQPETTVVASAPSPNYVIPDAAPVVMERPSYPGVVIRPSFYFDYAWGGYGHRHWH